MYLADKFTQQATSTGMKCVCVMNQVESFLYRWMRSKKHFQIKLFLPSSATIKGFFRVNFASQEITSPLKDNLSACVSFLPYKIMLNIN
jgi:hypothetical protein